MFFFPWPSYRMKAAEDPSTLWFVLQGKIIIAPLGGPARAQEGPDRTRNVPQKPVKQQLFPVRHFKVRATITSVEYRQRTRVLWNDPRGLWSQPPQVQPPWACVSRWPKVYVLRRVPSHHQRVRSLKTELLLWKSSVVIIPLDLQRRWPKKPLSPSDGIQLSDGALGSWYN